MSLKHERNETTLEEAAGCDIPRSGPGGAGNGKGGRH